MGCTKQSSLFLMHFLKYRTKEYRNLGEGSLLIKSSQLIFVTTTFNGIQNFVYQQLVTMNEVLNAIYKRRAVRKYTAEVVKETELEIILDAGRMAPSAMNKQGWMFHVANDPELIAVLSASILHDGKFAMLKEGLKEAIDSLLHPKGFSLKDAMNFFRGQDPIFHGAPLVIFLSCPKNNTWSALDLGMCAQNMMLAAYSIGLASCPIGLATFIEKTSHYEKLHVKKDHEIRLAIIFGHAAEEPILHERKKDNVVFIK